LPARFSLIAASTCDESRIITVRRCASRFEPLSIAFVGLPAGFAVRPEPAISMLDGAVM